MDDKIINIAQKRNEKSTEKKFIKILDKDISEGNIQEIPNSVFERIANIKHKALLARERIERVGYINSS